MLLDALREQLGLTGTKKGCDHGQCGACTVHRRRAARSNPASPSRAHEGDEITTIEGLGDAARCTRCRPPSSTPTASSAATARRARSCRPSRLTKEEPHGQASYAEPELRRRAPEAEIREQMSGNLCRCGAYPNIVAAIQQVRRSPREHLQP